MRIFFSLLLVIVFFAGGCAVLDSPTRLDSLQDRVDAVESRQEVIEDKLGMDSQATAYVEETEIVETSEMSPAEMSKVEVQRALQNAGYYNGPIDGKFGRLTRKAITDFQKDKRLKVDGIAGTQTKRALLRYLD